MKPLIGKLGEQEAKKYLTTKGYVILHENYRSRIGEIDLVAFYEDTLVFIEVKSRKSSKYGLPRESVTPYKQATIRKVAMLYIKHHQMQKSKIRFDVIEVYQEKTPWRIHHIPNAF